MRRHEFSPSRTCFQQVAIRRLVEVLPFRDVRRTLPATCLARLLVMAASLGVSLSTAAQRTRRSPSDETVRQGLVANLSLPLPDLEACLARGLQATLPRRFFRRKR